MNLEVSHLSEVVNYLIIPLHEVSVTDSLPPEIIAL